MSKLKRKPFEWVGIVLARIAQVYLRKDKGERSG